MVFGLFSDIHYFSKPYRLRCALRLVKQADVLLIIGDLADRGTEEQFSQLLGILAEETPQIPVFPVCGNHDVREDMKIYKAFEESVFSRFSCRYSIEESRTGAYYAALNEEIDLIGLNPLYYQKLFHFPDRSEQLDFLEAKLNESTAQRHMVLCHPPLIAHNPQRTLEMPSYLPKEQDRRLQRIVEEYGHIDFLSGHTHFAPTVERDEIHDVLYINDGSIIPTTAGANGETQRGNVFLLDEKGVFEKVEIKGTAQTLRR